MSTNKLIRQSLKQILQATIQTDNLLTNNCEQLTDLMTIQT